MCKTSNLYLPFLEISFGKKKRTMRRRRRGEITIQTKGNIVGLLIGMIFKVFNWSPAQAPCSENPIRQ